MSDESATYQPVLDPKELEKIGRELQGKAHPLAGQTTDQHQFLFTLLRIEGGILVAAIEPPASRALKTGEPMQILFGLPDGLFVARTQVQSADYDQATFPLGNEVYRLQRRHDFRALLPPEFRIAFRLTSLKTSMDQKGTVLSPLDLSRGGMRLRWPAANLVRPTVGDGLSGTLVLLGGKQIEVFGVVRTVAAADATAFHVGVEFQNLGQREEQAVLFTCMEALSKPR